MSSFIDKISNSPLIFEYPCKYDSTKCHPIEVNLTKGFWKLEVWGASGGDALLENTQTTCEGGKGGYSVGVLKLYSDSLLYLYIGGKGLSKFRGNSGTRIDGGFNGGGRGYIGNLEFPGASGGGSTDIRLGNNSLYNRIIVAGGGGGASAPNSYDKDNCYGGSGGGLSGLPSGMYTYDIITFPHSFAEGGNQTHGGLKTIRGDQTGGDGDFLYGGNATMGSDQDVDSSSGGGGSGYYGGGGGQGTGGGGGSGYIGGVSSFLKLRARTYTGEEFFPKPNVIGNEQGHIGNGAVRITLINTMIISIVMNRKILCSKYINLDSILHVLLLSN